MPTSQPRDRRPWHPSIQQFIADEGRKGRGAISIWHALQEQQRNVPYATVYGYLCRARRLGKNFTPAFSKNPKGKAIHYSYDKPEPTWMHGNAKQCIRSTSQNLANKLLQVPLVGSVVSLPYNKLAETRAYFNGFNVVGPESQFLFFEANPEHALHALEVFQTIRGRDSMNLITGDILVDGLALIPNRSVVAFDLDFMSIPTPELITKVKQLILTKRHPDGFYAFVNNSYGRAITYEGALVSHQALGVNLATQLAQEGVEITVTHERYRDSYPMLATTIIGVK